jgi:hypothetical protein
MKPVFSFILPVFNEEETLAETYRRLAGIMGSWRATSVIRLLSQPDCVLRRETQW